MKTEELRIELMLTYQTQLTSWEGLAINTEKLDNPDDITSYIIRSNSNSEYRHIGLSVSYQIKEHSRYMQIIYFIFSYTGLNYMVSALVSI